MRRIGLLGGTFDPPHYGHLIMAEEARIQGNLDEVWWIPNRIPPHKAQPASSSEADRVAMVEEMVKEHKDYKLSRVEIDRGGLSYTVDTIAELQSTYADSEFSFIMGGDSLLHFHKWHDWERLGSMLPFIVLPRPGFDWPSSAVPEELLMLDEVSLELSSSYLRKKIKAQEENPFLFTSGVYRYIKEHRLYG
ncbi:nicotinate-nucleotide adenylyltransferase [Salisediminibacterium halotolerans]|uniref:Probable nicotinate-nucleotide adenylyltransferase n=1 Tax=Salisediminibacterium halotolerans TaxID=517425 RepID=A0A1H9S4A0_9BACI|nr:nicotinate-nucleotide adenylyltransferase [Salisediminibacterium haloalkalitolerans]SER79811.1 nicotinate-nucleotide adenylyltransferase [Salisediminibacterium haloalkalitolerans]